MLAVSLTNKDFSRLSAFIEKELGIKMPGSKRPLLESRLQKRLRELGLDSFTDYCDYVFSGAGAPEEVVRMIDLVTTNKTDFFREPDHFVFMRDIALPDLLRRKGAGVSRPLKIWSAGCSTGEEPYTIAMTVNEFGYGVNGGNYDYCIYATDVSTRVLETARKAVYCEDRVGPIPMEYRRRYLLRSRDSSKGQVRIAPGLRARVRFGRLNFMEEGIGVGDELDIIFCRNVVIYFDKETQEELFSKLCGNLAPGGYLLIGHSETLNGFDLPLEKVSASAFRKVQG